MVDIDYITNKESIWSPQFIENISPDLCLDCDKFYEVSGRNAFKMQSMTKENLQDSEMNQENSEVVMIANSQQCADCTVCISSKPQTLNFRSSFSA